MLCVELFALQANNLTNGMSVGSVYPPPGYLRELVGLARQTELQQPRDTLTAMYSRFFQAERHTHLAKWQPGVPAQELPAVRSTRLIRNGTMPKRWDSQSAPADFSHFRRA
jgi:hypothetical protein